MVPIQVVAVVLASGLATAAKAAAVPDCSGVDRWPTTMAFVHLKNAGITNNDKLDFSKTRTVRLTSEKVGDDLFRQIHRVTFVDKSGGTVEVITSNEASNEECSMGPVEVFVISQQLGKR